MLISGTGSVWLDIMEIGDLEYKKIEDTINERIKTSWDVFANTPWEKHKDSLDKF